MADENKNKKDDLFSIGGADEGDIPSVTRLLNRKSLGLKKAEKKEAQPEELAYTAPETEEVKLEDIQLSGANAPVEADSHTMEIFATPPEEKIEEKLETKDHEPAVQSKPSKQTELVSATDTATESAPLSEPTEGISLSFESGASFELESSKSAPIVEEEKQPEEILPEAVIERTSSAVDLEEAPALEIAPVAEIEPIAEIESLAEGVKEEVVSEPKVTSSSRSGSRPSSSLARVESKNLSGKKDAIGDAFRKLVAAHASAALYLKPDSAAPTLFKASDSLNPESHFETWNGMNWIPRVMPKLWNTLTRTGFAEFGPPGALTQATSDRNVTRAAFGVGKTEWLTLVYVKSGAAAGLYAVLSSESKGDGFKRVME